MEGRLGQHMEGCLGQHMEGCQHAEGYMEGCTGTPVHTGTHRYTAVHYEQSIWRCQRDPLTQGSAPMWSSCPCVISTASTLSFHRAGNQGRTHGVHFSAQRYTLHVGYGIRWVASVVQSSSLSVKYPKTAQVHR